jgi:tetratricopeptide (TPR) repeat protein
MMATAVLIAGLVYLGLQEVRAGHEYVWLQRARHAEFLSPDQIAAREKAFAAEPKDFQTAYAIGEAYWLQNVEGGENWRELTTNAMAWFARGTNLNRFDGYNYMRYGMCLDRLERFDDAEPYFNKADELDPDGYFTAAHGGGITCRWETMRPPALGSNARCVCNGRATTWRSLILKSSKIDCWRRHQNKALLPPPGSHNP